MKIRGARVFGHRAIVRVRRNGTHWHMRCHGATVPESIAMTTGETLGWLLFGCVIALPFAAVLMH